MAASTKHRALLVTGAVLVLVIALVAGGLGLYRWVSSWWDRATPPDPHCAATIDATTATLTFEQARNASIIAGVAANRGLAPRAVSIALATAFQESNLLNLDYGDRDSLGLFQQRPSMGWGTPEEIMDPYYSTGKFFDVMVTVSDWSTSDIGDVAQAVQRSGFPDAYDQHVDRARRLASALTGESPAAWSCVGSASPSDGATASPADPASPLSGPDQLVSALTQAYGPTVETSLTPAEGALPAQLTLTTANEATAWSVAAFAQSWSTRTGVSQVDVGQDLWHLSVDTLTEWTDRTEGALPPGSVLVTF